MRFPILAIALVISPLLSSPIRAEPVRFPSTPSVSPTGEQIYFSWRGDIWKSSTEGGRIERVTSDNAQETSPRISHSGKDLFYASNKSGVNQVYRMPIEGGIPVQLTFHSEGSIPIALSADDEVVFTLGQRDDWWRWTSRFHKISSTKPQTGESQLFNAYGSGGSVSLAGDVLYSREGMSWSRKQYTGSRSGQIWLWNKETNSHTRIASEGMFDVRYPLWHPNGTQFFYVSEEDGTKNIWHYDLRTEKRKQLTKFEDDGVISPSISADGTLIAFRRLFDLYTLDPRKNRPPSKLSLEYHGDLFVDDKIERSLQKATSAVFSKTGKTLAFIAGGDVWVMDDSLKEPVQITTTPFHESDLVYDESRNRLLFVSSTNGQVDIYQATRHDNKLPWWRNSRFDLDQLTNDTHIEKSLSLSPKLRYLSYVKYREGLWVQDLNDESALAKPVVESWSPLTYSWSPDEAWLSYSAADNNFNYDVHVVDVDNPEITFNVSKHPDNEFGPVWSPDGKTLAFVGRRFDDEYDIYYVSLGRERDERTLRDEKLEQALKVIENEELLQDPPPTDPASKTSPTPATIPARATMLADLNAIHKRIRKVSIPSATETELVWSPDSKKLAFQAEIDGKQGVYTIAPYLSSMPTFLVQAKATILQWRKMNNRIYWLKDGVPGWTSGSGTGSAAFNFRTIQAFSRSEYHREIFDECWRIMRDDFYDGSFNNRNWDEIRRKYLAIAEACMTKANLSRTVSMMLGELNASHLGYRGSSDPSPKLSSRDVTGHLGLIPEPLHRGPGIKIKEVVTGGPAAAVKTALQESDIILSINDVTIDPGFDLTRVLNGSVGKETVLHVKRGDEELDITIVPITYAAFRSLLYEHWLQANRQRVEKQSESQLGYLHIRAMDMSSFHRFERELYEVAAGKNGLVIDVRENGGGFTTDHLLTILTQPRHAITKPRGGGEGYPQDRSIYATWGKPIVVLCNQNSHSNAEIFSHAIKHLQRGKIVGVPTSGSVISTGSRPVMDAGTIRIPFRGWYVLGTGQDMELNGAVPHYTLWPEPGQMPTGIDIQLDKAITVLKKEVNRAAKEVTPKTVKASERRLQNEE